MGKVKVYYQANIQSTQDTMSLGNMSRMGLVVNKTVEESYKRDKAGKPGGVRTVVVLKCHA